MVEILDFRLATHASGLGTSAEPRLSWRYSDLAYGSAKWLQQSCDIEIHRPNRSRDTKTVTINSSVSVSVAWPDSPLNSREMVSLRVRAHGTGCATGETQSTIISTPWSSWLPVEAALLLPGDFAANFITSALSPVKAIDDGMLRPIRLRKAFELDATPAARARLYVTALGLYVAYLNGKRIGDEHMAPGYTSYHHRIQYQVHDVTSLLNLGCENILAIEIAEGWFAGRIAWNQCARSLYGDMIGALVQLEIFSGEETTPLCIRSDDTWVSRPSPILYSGIWPGEMYDRQLETTDWNQSTNQYPSASDWESVKVMAFPAGKLVEASAPGVKVTQIIKPTNIIRSASGKAIIDFGQNMAGKIQIHRLRRPPGHRLQMRHAEVLEHGEVAMRPLRTAKATDTIIFGKDDELNDWSVQFTYHGFRYVEFDGWSTEDEEDPLTMDSVSALVMHTDMGRTGYFESSNELLNRLHENVVWSMRSNFFSIPTDCPQRDERMGWTGDIQVFAPTASFLYDCDLMLSNWMKDVIHEQRDCDGTVPFVVPNCLLGWKWPSVAQAIWDDVVILLPWILYTHFGDIETLRQSYSGMQDHLNKSIPRGPDGLWDANAWQLGDWLDPNAPPQEPGLSRTDGTLVADEYLVYVTKIMARISTILGYSNEAEHYNSAHERLAGAFRSKYMAPSGLVVGDSQTSLALALNFSLHDTEDCLRVSQYQRVAEERANASDRLARLVRYAKFRVSTGFAGTTAVLHALSATGHLQTAYRMLLEEACPSWLYAVKMGGTTVWERWDSMLPDGSVNPGTMTSFNHYALGAVAHWIHKVVGGLAPLSSEPGWRKFVVYPRPGGDVRSCRVEFKSPCGWIKCEWKVSDEMIGPKFKLDLTVPPNSTALVVLPRGKLVEDVEREAETVGSGCYSFECDYHSEGLWPPKAMLTEFREDV